MKTKLYKNKNDRKTTAVNITIINYILYLLAL